MGTRLSTGTPRRSHGLRAGVSFLTRVPVGAGIGEADIAASVAWFPVVGAAIGVAAGLVYVGASELWPAAVASILSIGVAIAITGGFHEDGLADTADAFGASSTGRDPGPVLKDPRLGAFGVLALVLGIGARVAALASLPAAAGWSALIAAHALARGVSAGVIVVSPSTGDGLGSSYARLTPRWRGVLGLTIGAGVAVAMLGATGLIAVAVAIAAAVLLARWAARSLGAVSGDVLGAIEQIGEIVTLLAAAAAIHRGWVFPL
jgi:adenosylcobinamide-GDP ribazoletransferase